jgi:hypothetical protein
LFFALVCAGFLHGGLLASGLIMVAGVLMLIVFRSEKISFSLLVLVSIFSSFILFFGFSFFSDVSYNLNDGLASAIEVYQVSALEIDARTVYKTGVDISGLDGFLLFIPLSIIQYFFEPFPWHVSAVSDFILLLENILRGWLILRVLWSFRVASKIQHRLLLLIFISYLVMETIWSIGTINWGTAVRHHLPSWGLLLLAAFAVYDVKKPVEQCTQS